MNRSFDYQIWKSEEGAYFVRIRRTGQVTRISDEVCRYLRREEKRETRTEAPRAGRSGARILSLDTPVSGRDHSVSLSDVLPDSANVIEEADIRMDVERFEASLPPGQRKAFHAIYREGCIPARYAAARGIRRQTVYGMMDAIEKKAKKFFSEP